MMYGKLKMDPGEEHPCEGCDHFYGDYKSNRCCNYIFDMGHSRPCEFGEKCLVRTTKRYGKTFTISKK